MDTLPRPSARPQTRNLDGDERWVLPSATSSTGSRRCPRCRNPSGKRAVTALQQHRKPLFATNSVAMNLCQSIGRPVFYADACDTICRCVKLGIVFAQLPGCPQAATIPGCCPRRRDSGKRGWPTGLGGAQVLAVPGKKAVVHTKSLPLLLRLCIYKENKEEDRDNFPGALAHAEAGAGWVLQGGRGRRSRNFQKGWRSAKAAGHRLRGREGR